MTDYFYDMDLVVDPLNPSNVVANGSVAIYDPADVTGTTLLALKDPSGLPLPNPLTSNANGFLPPRIAQVPQTLWKSGGFEGYFNSYRGLRDEAVAAKTAAQEAIGYAAEAAGEAVSVATVNPEGNLILTKSNGETKNAGSVKGPKGDKGDKGNDGVNGSNVLPTQQAIEQAITTDGPAKTALSATVLAAAGVVAAPAPSGGDDTAALQAIIDGGASSIRLKSFAAYKVTSLTAPARELTFEGIGSTLTGTTSSPIVAKNGAFRVGFVGVDTALSSEANKVTDAMGRIHRFGGQVYARAERDSDRGALDFANFAGQGTSTSITGFLFHNYTDSSAVRIDNVGSGSALVLKNAQNATRRNDKASTYVGDGNFLRLIAHDDAAGISRDLMFIDRDGRMVWTGATKTSATGGRARFLANKADDGQMAYFFELTNPHLNVATFGNVLNIRNDNSLTRATVQSQAGQTGGLMMESLAGPIFLTPNSYIQVGGQGLRFITALSSATATAGAATLPAAPEGFITASVSGTTVKIPYYKN